MPLTQSTTPAAAPATLLRAQRLRRAVVGALLATGAGAGTVAIARATDDDARSAPGAARQLRITLHLEDRRDLSVCETAACPAPVDAAARPRRERVHRVRTFTLSWAAPAAAATVPPSVAGAAP